MAKLHGASSLQVLGSRSREDHGPASDLDLLVEFEEGRSLLDAVGLEQDLSDLLGIRVQIVTPASLSPHIRAEVLAEARAL